MMDFLSLQFQITWQNKLLTVLSFLTAHVFKEFDTTLLNTKTIYFVYRTNITFMKNIDTRVLIEFQKLYFLSLWTN